MCLLTVLKMGMILLELLSYMHARAFIDIIPVSGHNLHTVLLCAVAHHLNLYIPSLGVSGQRVVGATCYTGIANQIILG